MKREWQDISTAPKDNEDKLLLAFFIMMVLLFSLLFYEINLRGNRCLEAAKAHVQLKECE